MNSRQATLHKIFNRNTVKISYSCMPNIKQTIDGHKKTKLSQTATTSEESTCNCRKKEECPMSKKCLVESIVYQAIQFLPTTIVHLKHTLVSLTENSFKTRYYNHKTSFRLLCTRKGLSKYVWQLKRRGIEFHIKWQTLKQAKPYSPASNRCNLQSIFVFWKISWHERICEIEGRFKIHPV
jgi:hypothetical protein